MLNHKISWYWKITWVIVTPVSLIAIFVYGHVTEGSSTGLPPSGQIIGWVMAAIAIGQVLLWMIIAFIRAPGYNAREKFKATFTATESFGPRDPKIRKDWNLWKKKTASAASVFSISGQTNPTFCEDVDG